MKMIGRIAGAATAAGFAAMLSLSALAQSTPGTPPDNVTVPNTGTAVHCNADGTATVTQNPNATQSTEGTVPGTPVTQNNPNGPGTTTSQTPMLQKPPSVANVQCPKTTVPTTTTAPMNTYPTTPQSTGNGPAGSEMNALTNNPNGSNWTDKFNRPVTNSTPVSGMHTRHKHHMKPPSHGGGGQ